jgi:prepilin-type processing-associated H-X9-DG protein/prepilin-type N-terminal cleavage/methylation domain-containing protein
MKQFSFTLVELLVVISIIAIIVAILVPALQSFRQQAKAALCTSNIKQLMIGLFAYENQNLTLPFSIDNTSHTPPPGGYPGYGQYDRKGWWWFNFIKDFYRKSDTKITVVQCPSKQLTDSMLKNNILCGNYGINRSICKSSDDRQSNREEFVGKPLSFSQIPNPGKTLLIVDSGYAMISWWYATDKPPVVLNNTTIEDTTYVPGLEINRNRILWPGQEQDAIYGRHPNKTVNVGFVDGHISRTKADDLFVEKTEEGYKNKIPLWGPK